MADLTNLTWEELERKCRECALCPLHETRTNCVFGTGNREADLMFIGEAPGESEDLSGTPFVGRAGKLFDKYLEAVEIDRNEVYICNILKCRPPKNRDPKPEEGDLCLDYLRAQVKLVNPKLIVCLGRIAAQRLIKPDIKILKEHGIWVRKGSFEMTAVYHPSLLLRDPRKKEDMLADMQMIKARYEEMRSR